MEGTWLDRNRANWSDARICWPRNTTQQSKRWKSLRPSSTSRFALTRNKLRKFYQRLVSPEPSELQRREDMLATQVRPSTHALELIDLLFKVNFSFGHYALQHLHAFFDLIEL